MTATLEIGGISALWNLIEEHLIDPRWQEVIRLLVASLKTDESQEFLIKKIIEKNETDPDVSKTSLLGGLLLDGVKSAENNQKSILISLFNFLKCINNREINPKIIDLLSMLSMKFQASWDESFKYCWVKDESLRSSMLLLCLAINLSDDRKSEILVPRHLNVDQSNIEILALVFGNEKWPNELSIETFSKLNIFSSNLALWARTSPVSNFWACIAQCMFFNIDDGARKEYLFKLQLSVFGHMHGPFEDFYKNYSLLNMKSSADPGVVNQAIHRALKNYIISNGLPSNQRTKIGRRLYSKDLERVKVHVEGLTTRITSTLNRNSKITVKRNLRTNDPKKLDYYENRYGAKFHSLMDDFFATIGCEGETDFWSSVLNSDGLLSPVVQSTVSCLNLDPSNLWGQAIHQNSLQKFKKQFTYLDDSTLLDLTEKFKNCNYDSGDCWLAASFHLYDAWLFLFSGYDSLKLSPIANLNLVTNNIPFAPLKHAKRIREALISDSRNEIHKLVSN